MKGNHEKVRISLGKNINRDLLKLEKITPRSLFKRVKELEPEDFQYYVTSNLKLNFFNNAKFSKGALEEDKENIISYYNSLGYRDAEIVH